jgi:hypothetical protein
MTECVVHRAVPAAVLGHQCCCRGVAVPARCWADHDGELPVIEGTLIRLRVEQLPGDRDPEPVWL